MMQIIEIIALLQVLTYLALGQHLIDANMVCRTNFVVSVTQISLGELGHLLSQHSTVAFVRHGETRYIRSGNKILTMSIWRRLWPRD